MMIVFMAEQVLQKDLQRDRRLGDVLKATLFEQIEPKNVVALAAHRERLSRAETIHVLLSHSDLLMGLRLIYFVARVG
jgi:hypothetical protein